MKLKKYQGHGWLLKGKFDVHDVPRRDIKIGCFHFVVGDKRGRFQVRRGTQASEGDVVHDFVATYALASAMARGLNLELSNG